MGGAKKQRATRSLTVQISEEVYAALVEMAEKSLRPVTYQAAWLVAEGVVKMLRKVDDEDWHAAAMTLRKSIEAARRMQQEATPEAVAQEMEDSRSPSRA